MISTPYLAYIRERLERTELDWDEAVRRYKKHPQYDVSNDFPFNEYEIAFKDHFVRISLENAMAENARLKITGLAIKNERYYLERDDMGRVLIFGVSKKGKREKRSFITYETLLKVNGTPTAIESGVSRFIPLRRLEREMGFMEDIFGDEFGYIIFSPKEYFISPHAKIFQREGGLLARFPLGKDEFREELRSVLIKNRMKIREGATSDVSVMKAS